METILIIMLFAFILFYLEYKFHIPGLERFPWTYWFVIFCIASMVDITSTYYAVYIYHIPWSQERNVIVQLLGPVFGFDIVFKIWNGVLIALLLMCGLWIKKKDGKFFLLFGLYYFTIIRFFATGFNMLQP